MDDEHGSNPYRVIGKGIREARERRGLSLEHLAAQADIGHDVLYRIEIGAGEYPVQTIERIAAVLGLSVVTLISLAYRLTPAAD